MEKRDDKREENTFIKKIGNLSFYMSGISRYHPEDLIEYLMLYRKNHR